MEIKANKSAAGLRGIPEDLPTKTTAHEVMKGLKVWRNVDNHFTVARLHYSADPKKDTDEWRTRTKSGYTWQEWLQEYEIVDSAFEGMPVYGEDFSIDFHISREPLVWKPELPVIRGWDFGLAAEGMACVFVQLVPPSRLFVYNELTASDLDLEHFAPEVRARSMEWFPHCKKWFDVVDPSGFARSKIDKRQEVKIIRDVLRTKPMPGAISKVERRRAVSRFLTETRRGQPAMLVDARCKMLVDGFVGGYHYAWTKYGHLADEPEKNEYSHIHDALQYLCTRVLVLHIDQSAPTVHIPSPNYKFAEKGVTKVA